jgi:type III secretory pathway component EscT
LYSPLESARAALFFSLNQENDVGIETLFIGQLMRCVNCSHDWALVVRHAPAVQVAALTCQGKGVVLPLAMLILGWDDIVVAVEEYLLS